MPAAVKSAPCSSSFGSFLSHSERDARTSAFSESVRVICQYQPDSGSSNSGSPSAWHRWSGGSPGGAASAVRVRREGGARAGWEAGRYTDESTWPVISRITTTHAVADRNSRVASELPRIRTWSPKHVLGPRPDGRMPVFGQDHARTRG